MILLDTTILVYAVGTDHPLRAPCRRLIELAAEARIRATTTVEVVQEFTHVRSRRTTRAEAAARARSYAVGLGPLVRPSTDDLVIGLGVFEKRAQLGAFDAVLAAVAQRRGLALASADRAFRRVPRLVYLDPGAADFLDDVLASGQS